MDKSFDYRVFIPVAIGEDLLTIVYSEDSKKAIIKKGMKGQVLYADLCYWGKNGFGQRQKFRFFFDDGRHYAIVRAKYLLFGC